MSSKSPTEKRRERRNRRKELANSVETTPRHATIPPSQYYTLEHLGEAHPLRAILTDQQWTNLSAATSSSSLASDKARSNGPRSAIYDTGETYNDLRARVDDLFWNLHNTQDVWDPEVRGVLTHPGYSSTEQKQRDKFGPYMSAYSSEVADKLRDYFGDEFAPCDTISKMVTEALDQVANDLRDANGGSYLSPISIETAYELMPKDKFYGYPHFTSKWAEDDLIVSETIDLATRISQLDRDAIDIYHKSPWVIFNRVVPNGYEAPKVRATMAPAKYGALFEKTFTHPVLQALKLTEWGVGYQGNHVVGPIIQEWVSNYLTTFSMDYEAFDQHTKSYARKCVRDVLIKAFGPEHTDALTIMFDAFDNPGVILGRSVIYATEGFGLGSGIGPTGIIGTIWNRIIAVCLMDLMNQTFNVTDIKHLGYGDDTLLCFNSDTHIPTSWFYDQIRRFGMVINPDKQEYSSGKYRYASFLALQYYWLEDISVCSKGVYSIYRAWARILFKDVQTDQEDKWIRAEYEGLSPVGCDMLDTIATLENCKNNPAFPTFVSLVRTGHPLHLKSSHFLPATKLATYTGEEHQGLKAFSSVREIIRLEVLEGELGVIDDMEWQRYCLSKFSYHIWRSKGILISTAQAIDYLNGRNVHWDGQQLADAAARGIANRQPLADRVHELELRKGIRLSAAQVSDLRYGRKIRWTERDRARLQEFGQLSDSQKDLWRASHEKSVIPREVIDNGSKYDFETLWHSVHHELIVIQQKKEE